MALVLHIENRKSSEKVKEIFEAADSGEITVHVPAIVFAEILYLSEKGRIGLRFSDLQTHFSKFPTYKQFPLSFEIVQNAEKISDIPELHDRLIGAAANLAGLELVTNDPKIQNSAFVNTIW